MRTQEPQTRAELSAMTWALKEYGDINENGKGGNAAQTLRDRLSDLGLDMDQHTYRLRMAWLLKHQIVSSVAKGNRAFIIRLIGDPIGENPFKTNQQGSLLPAKPEGRSIAPLSGDDIFHLPITDRLELIKQLSDSVQEDHERIKAAF